MKEIQPGMPIAHGEPPGAETPEGQPLAPGGSPHFPRTVGSIPPTTREEIDEALTTLRAHKDEWAALGVDERIAILDAIRADLRPLMQRWVDAGLSAKGLSSDPRGEVEAWVLLAAVFGMLRVLRRSLRDIRTRGRPRIPGPVTQGSDGQVVVQVFPQTLVDRIFYQGITAEVWMEPGTTAQEAIQTQARIYRDERPRGSIVLVLGAGNLVVLPLADMVYKLFLEHQVVVLKMNPVNDYLGPLVERGFRALIDRGFLRIAYGGVAEGAYLAHHQAVDELHITGSDKTYEAIVFGSGAEGAARKAKRAPLLTKRFTAELGNVSPVIVVPGPWSDREVQQQATEIASWLTYNAGYNCLTPRVIVQHKQWERRRDLVAAIGEVFSVVPTRKAYYPGAGERHAAYLAAHPDALQYGASDHGHLPWTLVHDVDPAHVDDLCFRTEAFCSLFAETALEAESVPDYIERAVQFANDTLWGTLCATVIVHPASLDDPEVSAALDRALVHLRYGMVCVNYFPGFANILRVTPWGSYPGQEIYDVQSGIGVTNNFLMFERPQKSVVRAPFTKRVNPTVATIQRFGFGKKLAAFEASPSVRRLIGALWAAMRS
jgi:acyl-CoA reductase-like NAD-dependent aldehyde dehydrogenase